MESSPFVLFAKVTKAIILEKLPLILNSQYN